VVARRVGAWTPPRLADDANRGLGLCLGPGARAAGMSELPMVEA